MPRSTIWHKFGEERGVFDSHALGISLAAKPVSIVYPKHPFAREWPVGGAVQASAVDLADAIDRETAGLSASGELNRIFSAYGVTWRRPKEDQ
ncbi:hypothetical protein K9U39_20260 [Rhodoblastus acidophilus]|uniref:Solute-binding protein family 3/N-terminal domain-containing protein n=1 Tax=Candidatus Rhodoblastus alkanivorans TaxID=2954117 RepID=A0ABS9ZBP2_9HYPH|nr:hypothetical protein [Candidatus Rhodoblastus alkanivorans]MCI4679110.1 hypothetical protein [Candidatus Rhodoblastus alkanivorans]MCI4685002.1 hypothetical protein [Candidatus Rhodoblastus alkanivorans]MDI4643227.1 hypothetical protein [Rhodoblastus acidophilus]